MAGLLRIVWIGDLVIPDNRRAIGLEQLFNALDLLLHRLRLFGHCSASTPLDFLERVWLSA
jgi:hypothetical protein